ncbi:MAG: recombinase family protein [Oleispira sp.]|nr:recombinase family protein [Oleispira sp.]MBL4881181.1 recombinase family protein [Oleispira sp.]
MSRLYSYIRFSTAEQAEGSSSTRQAEYAAKYAAENGLTLDESLSMRDEGLSAYHQTHIKKGALGVFLRAIEDGLIPEGSTLIIEALDRLSRAEPIISQALLSQIINAGITVVTASDGKRYDRESLKANPMDLVYSLLVLIRAHEESDTKSKRVNAAIRIACEAWISGTKRAHIRNGKPPKWYRETGNVGAPLFEIIPERAEVLREAIALYVEGWSGVRIGRKLNDEGKTYTGKKLIGNYIYKIIARSDLIGSKSIEVEGEVYELKDYYPPILTPEEYEALQNKMRNRPAAAKSGIPGIVTNLNLCRCGYCGASVAGVNYIGRARADGVLAEGHRRLICNEYNSNKTCVVGSSIKAGIVERAIMNYCCDQMNIADLTGQTNKSDDVKNKLNKIESEIAESSKMIDKLTDALLQTDTPPIALMRKQRELEEIVRKLEEKRLALSQQMRINHSAVNSDLLEEWQALVVDAVGLDYEARMKVRGLVSRTFERIELYVRGFAANKTGAAGRIAVEVFEKKLGIAPDFGTGKVNEHQGPVDLVLRFRGGAVRLLRIDRNSGAWQAQVDF